MTPTTMRSAQRPRRNATRARAHCLKNGTPARVNILRRQRAVAERKRSARRTKTRVTKRTPLHAVVMAGGAGTRFWPLSRARRPKPLLAELSGRARRTLLDDALARARRVAGAARVWLVCGREHAAQMRRASGLPAARVLVEPAMRNTAAANALAAARIAREEPDAMLAVLAADQRVPDERAFARAIKRAAAAADDGALVTLGIQPTRAETRYGYIRLGRASRAHAGVFAVARFVEKPDVARARRWFQSENYFWNAGIFVWRARAVLDELARCAPRVARAIKNVREASARELPKILRAAYARVPAISIDHALLEKSRRVRCLPVDFAWSDIGTWRALAEALGTGAQKSCVLTGEAQFECAPGNLVVAGARPVVLFGVSGLAVVDAGDVLLVTSLARSDEMGRVVASLRGARRRKLL